MVFCWAATATSAGGSALHGRQLDWKKFSTTQLPLRRLRSNGLPSSVVLMTAGAGLPLRNEDVTSGCSVLLAASTTNSAASRAATASETNGATRRRRSAGPD